MVINYFFRNLSHTWLRQVRNAAVAIAREADREPAQHQTGLQLPDLQLLLTAKSLNASLAPQSAFETNVIYWSVSLFDFLPQLTFAVDLQLFMTACS